MIEIKEEFKKLIPALTAEEFKQLEENILKDGIRDPLVLWNGYLIEGHNRYQIAFKHGLEYKTIDKEFDSELGVKIWMVKNQFGRRNLQDFVKGELITTLEDLEKQKGKEKQLQTLKQGVDIPVLSIIDKTEKHNTREIVAEKLGWSTGKKAQFDVVVKKAPEKIKEKLRTGEVSINQVYQDIKKDEKKEIRDKKIEEIKVKIETENLSLKNKKYHVIAIDPPWAYNEKGGFSSDDYNSQSNRGAVDYPTLSVEQIKKIELPEAEDCVLFLWTTHAFLKDSFEILNEWGYNYKATLVWDKVKMGLGRTIRMQVEFCLIAIKGNPIINGNSERDIITESRREHSRKPEAFYEMVDRMCIGNKLDYFSRQNRINWEHYGAEQGQF